MPRSKRDNDKGAAPGHARPRKPSLADLADLDDLDARPFARKRLLDAARDDREWSGTGDTDTVAETARTHVDAGLPTGLPPGLATDLATDLHEPLHDSDFTDEDTFTDRDTDASAGSLTGGLPGETIGRDTMLELTPRDTLLDLAAAARAVSASADSLPGDRTLDDDAFPDEDTEPGK